MDSGYIKITYRLKDENSWEWKPRHNDELLNLYDRADIVQTLKSNAKMGGTLGLGWGGSR